MLRQPQGVTSSSVLCLQQAEQDRVPPLRIALDILGKDKAAAEAVVAQAERERPIIKQQVGCAGGAPVGWAHKQTAIN